MDLAKKLAKIFSLIFLAVVVASCDTGCVEANEFDKEIIKVQANPVQDGIDGLGDAQVAKWHDTGLKTNGEGIVLQITGGWVPWYGNDDLGSDDQLRSLDACKFCAMNGNSPNCICYSGQTPESEPSYIGTDCVTNLTAQNDPNKCTCTTKYGSATDYGVYHFTLNKYDKFRNDLIPDFQSPCRYQAGMGLYMGLFGSSGSVIPTRIYHLFSQTEVCDVVRDPVTDECLDEDGNDVTKYLFTSANDQIFVKDDGEGNLGSNTSLSDDTLHTRNEVAKLIIYDSRYDDNYGEYQVTFLGGLGQDQDSGLLEFLVSLMENQIMGTPDSSGVRQGGIIQTMFNQIVLDSGFSTIVQMALSFYILFYGVSVLIGLADVTKKELMTRMLKIALVMFFTSASSWYWYDKIVVTFFKDGMDSVITMFMNFSDQNLDPTSGIVTAQMDRASSNSNATRFSYADLIIRNLLSIASAKKIFGLFFGVPIFGPIYIAAIYALIAFFVYVMLTVAMAYVVTIVKLAFVLSLGPIFIAFTLSGHTNDMFKKWLGFVGARSLEIIFMFLVLYNFLVLIDQNFTSLLSYRACVTNWNLGLFSIPILKSSVDRSLMEWCSSFIMIGGLIFITKLVLDKVPDLCGSLISIGGAANKDKGAMGAAGSLMGGMMGAAQSAGGSALGMAAFAAAKTYQGVSSAMSGSGSAVANAMSGAIRALPGGNTAMDTAMKAVNAMPSNPRAMYRNSVIDSAISEATKNADSKGLTGKAKDEAIRNEVTNKLMSHQSNSTAMGSAPIKSIGIGMNLDSIGKRLDEKLINKPLTDFIKSEAAKLKSSANPPIGRELREQLGNKVKEWAEKNLAGGAESIKGIMNDRHAVVSSVKSGDMSFSNMRDFIRKQTEYSATEAAKAFANNPEKQKEFLQHLKDNEFRAAQDRQKVTDGAVSKSFNKFSNKVKDGFSLAVRAVKPFDNAFGNDAMTDSKRAAASFMRKVSNQEHAARGTTMGLIRDKTGGWLDHGQGSVLNPLNLAKSKDAIRQEVKEGDRSGLIRYLSKNGAEQEQKRIRENYDERKADKNKAPNHAARSELEKKKQEKIKDSKDRREFMKADLKKLAVKFAQKDSGKIAKDLKTIKDKEAEASKKARTQIGGRTLAALSLAAKKVTESSSEIIKANKRISALEKANLKETNKQREEQLKREKENLAKLEKERIAAFQEESDLSRRMKMDKDQWKLEYDRLEKDRKDLLKEVAKLKTENQSLEDIVKEIQDAKRKEPNAKDFAAATLAGLSTKDYRTEENLRAESLKKEVHDKLRDEYIKALEEQVKVQKAFIMINAEREAIIDPLMKSVASFKEGKKEGEEDAVFLARRDEAMNNAKELQALMAKYLAEDLPTKEEIIKGLEDQKEKEKDKDKKKEIEDLQKKLAEMSDLDANMFMKGMTSTEQDDLRKRLDAAGGLDAVKDGLTELDNTTLFEKAERLRYFEDSLADPKTGDAHIAEGDQVDSDIIGDEDVHLEFGDEERESEAHVGRTMTPEQQEFSDKMDEITASVEDKKDKGEESLGDEYQALEDLKKHPALGGDEEDGKDKGKGKPDETPDPARNEALKSILNTQIGILKTQIGATQIKMDKARDSMDKLRADLGKGDAAQDKAIQDKVAEFEAVIRGYESDISSIQNKLSTVNGDLTSLG